MNMLLKSLVSGLEVRKVCGSLNTPVEGVAYDSRKVKNNYLFACLKGENFDGRRFAGESVKKGASCLLCGEEIENLKAAQVVVENPRKALSSVSSRFYGNPSESMNVTGITGTNGKTSVSFLCEAIGKEAGFRTGVVGTINYRWGGRLLPALQTTPESLDAQHILKQMKDYGCEHVFMEASSHGIAQHRLDDVCFRTAIFTNLSPEHMDYHRDMEEYFRVKSILFEELLRPQGQAVINIDDDYGKRLAGLCKRRVLTCAIREAADVMAADIALGSDGVEFRVESDFGGGRVRMNLFGMGNVYNALSAICFGFVHGISFETAAAALRKAPSVKGRFEIINRGGDFNVVVDYAHTPGALGLLLDSARSFCAGRIITVFGCGGDRDRSKRPVMGGIAAEKSDYSVLTTDNPRSEDPESIIGEVEAGFSAAARSNYTVIADRKEAIRHAVASARKGDIVLIAGKGHETYQIAKNTVIPFNDAEVAREALNIVCRGEIQA